MKKTYYKITNKKECHNDFQYVDGLNVLDKLFEVEGSCVVGGLYFTTAKHILKFLGYGCYLREVMLPEDCLWIKDPDGDKFRANKIILGKRYDLSDPLTFQLLVEKGANMDNDWTFLWASKNKYWKIVMWLMEKGVDINTNNNCALMYASEDGQLEVVKCLIRAGANIYVRNDSALRLASMNGHFEVVQYLIEKGADIHARDDCALLWASRSGHLNIVKYLVESGADIHAKNDCALNWASKCGHLEIVQYLIESGANIHAGNDCALIWASENLNNHK